MPSKSQRPPMRRLTGSTASTPVEQEDVIEANHQDIVMSIDNDVKPVLHQTRGPSDHQGRITVRQGTGMTSDQQDSMTSVQQASIPAEPRKIKRTYYMSPAEVEMLDDFVYQESKRRRKKLTLSDAISEAIRSYVQTNTTKSV